MHRRVARLLVVAALVTAATLATGPVAQAAPQPVPEPTTSCDSDGVSVSYATEVTGGHLRVKSATVSGIDAGCTGSNLRVELRDAVTLLARGGPVPVGGPSAVVPFSTPPRAEAVAEVGVAIGGSAVPVVCLGIDASETLVGTDAEDRLRGGPGADLIFGMGDRDTLEGRGGHDCLAGGDGDDTLEGGRGDDRLDGGAGFDVCRGDRGDDEFVACEVVHQ